MTTQLTLQKWSVQALSKETYSSYKPHTFPHTSDSLRDELPVWFLFACYVTRVTIRLKNSRMWHHYNMGALDMLCHAGIQDVRIREDTPITTHWRISSTAKGRIAKQRDFPCPEGRLTKLIFNTCISRKSLKHLPARFIVPGILVAYSELHAFWISIASEYSPFHYFHTAIWLVTKIIYAVYQTLFSLSEAEVWGRGVAYMCNMQQSCIMYGQL